MRRLLTQLALLLASAAALLPLLWLLSTSLKTVDTVTEYPPRLFPHPLAPRNYLTVVQSQTMDFPLLTRNTLIIAVLTVLGTLISSSLVAYGFAKIRFPARGLLFGIMLSTMMIPGSVTLVAMFAAYRWLDDHAPIQFLGTAKPLWLPAWFSSAFNVFLLRQFFLTI